MKFWETEFVNGKDFDLKASKFWDTDFVNGLDLPIYPLTSRNVEKMKSLY